MHQYTPIAMQTTGLLAGAAGSARPSFVVASNVSYRVFLFPDALLFLERDRPKSSKKANNLAPVMMALGGAVGGLIAGAMMAGQADDDDPIRDESNLMTNEQLAALAKARRRSFVVDYSDIRYARVLLRSVIGRLFGAGRFGTLELRDRRIFTRSFEFHSKLDMLTAVESLPPRLGDRAHINVELDTSTATFVRK